MALARSLAAAYIGEGCFYKERARTIANITHDSFTHTMVMVQHGTQHVHVAGMGHHTVF